MSFATDFVVSSFRDTLGVPSTKVPINVSTFSSYVIPPLACYCIEASLAVTSQTRRLQVGLLPVFALLAFRAAVSVDISRGDHKLDPLNGELMRSMAFIFLNTLSWTFAEKPLVRYIRPANKSPSTVTDVLDLMTNFRGIGWNWSRGLHVPHETRPTNRMAFACYALLSVIAHISLSAIVFEAICTFIARDGSNYSIFDESLPFIVQYCRASIISILGASVTYTVVQSKYDLFTLVGILFFGQEPAQWPPVFDNPWRATSLSEFWGRRWHQFHRQTFILGGYSLFAVFGRVGWIAGSFLSSALFHFAVMMTFENGPEFWRMFIGFGMMGIGNLSERAFYKLTGKKVCGVIGWVWTMTWLLVWGNVIVDGFSRAGMFAQMTNDTQTLVGKLVIDFDDWLHTIQVGYII